MIFVLRGCDVSREVPLELRVPRSILWVGMFQRALLPNAVQELPEDLIGLLKKGKAVRIEGGSNFEIWIEIRERVRTWGIVVCELDVVSLCGLGMVLGALHDDGRFELGDLVTGGSELFAFLVHVFLGRCECAALELVWRLSSVILHDL